MRWEAQCPIRRVELSRRARCPGQARAATAERSSQMPSPRGAGGRTVRVVCREAPPGVECARPGTAVRIQAGSESVWLSDVNLNHLLRQVGKRARWGVDVRVLAGLCQSG